MRKANWFKLQWQWRIHGRGSGSPNPHFGLVKLRPGGLEKFFWRLGPPYLRVWMTGPPKVWIHHWMGQNIWQCLTDKGKLDFTWIVRKGPRNQDSKCNNCHFKIYCMRLSLQQRRLGYPQNNNYYPNHNYNKILKSDWLSTALISALIGQYALSGVLKQLFSLLVSKNIYLGLVLWFKKESYITNLLTLWLIGNRISCRPIWSVIILVIKQTRLPLCGRSILLITQWLQTELEDTKFCYQYKLTEERLRPPVNSKNSDHLPAWQ